jgi:hypothetical protein
MVSVNVNTSGVLSADWISGHGNSRQIIFIDVGATFFFSISEILEDGADVDNLIATFTHSHSFSFGSRKSDGVLTV